jgi:hypothetical protein
MIRGLKFGLQIEHKYADTFGIGYYNRDLKKKKTWRECKTSSLRPTVIMLRNLYLSNSFTAGAKQQ